MKAGMTEPAKQDKDSLKTLKETDSLGFYICQNSFKSKIKMKTTAGK